MRKMKKYICILISISVLFSFAFPVYAAEEKSVDVSSFGAIADDGEDDSSEIQNAVDYAIENNIPVVQFQAGVYNFSENPVSDANIGAYIKIIKSNGLTLAGSINDDGTPLTVFRRLNCGGDNVDLRQLIYAEQSENLTLRSIQCETYPTYYTAGEIVDYTKDTVTVKIAEGYPTPNQIGDTKIHLPGLYDKTSGCFYEQRLIWTKEDGSDAPLCNIPDESNPEIVNIKNEEIAKKVKKAVKDKGTDNLLMFWFQGHYTENFHMLYFKYCENLVFENITIPSSTGFALTCDMCRNITYRNIKLAPYEGKCAVAPRDAMKLYACGGDILMENTVMEGFEDDGQNCHGQFSTINRVEDEHTLILNITAANPYRPDWFNNTHIRFLTPDRNEIYEEVLIKSAKQINDTQWEFVTKETLPSDLVCSEENDFSTATIAELEAYVANSWTVRGCTIRSTYRGLKISAQNVLVENNLFENNVYQIYMGAENDPWWHESKNPINVTIRNNTFKNPLSGTAIDMDFHSYQDSAEEPLYTPVMSEIYIYNNKFIDCKLGVNVKDAKNVYIYDNTYENVKKETKLYTDTVKNIFYTSPDEAENTSPAEETAVQRQKLIIAAIVVSAVIVIICLVLAVAAVIKKRKNKISAD
ncbi:MAG: hypothetical protein ACLUFN_07730 [Eubacterium sp.]